MSDLNRIIFPSAYGAYSEASGWLAEAVVTANRARPLDLMLGLHFLQNVKEHAPLSARASVEHGDEVESTGEHGNRAADRGCCVSTCSALGFQLCRMDALPEIVMEQPSPIWMLVPPELSAVFAPSLVTPLLLSVPPV